MQGSGNADLAGERVYLRAVLDGDAARLYAYIRDPHVSRFLNVVSPDDFAMFAGRLREMLGGEDPRDVMLVIADRFSHAALGVVRLLRQGNAEANLSFWLGRDHWGKRCASEAIRLLARQAVSHLGISAFVAQVFGGNARSQNLLTHLGFKLMRTRPLKSTDLGRRQELTFRIDHTGLAALAAQLAIVPSEALVLSVPEPFDAIHAEQDWGSG